MITSLRGACTASDEAIHSKTLNLQDCRAVPPSSCHAVQGDRMVKVGYPLLFPLSCLLFPDIRVTKIEF
ncbi:MAG: hypothetical protein LBK53_00135 [Heliobacteriaceae bacterium]|nr:hypothetical protein [Heliobacteriaceae bacterium]